MPTSVNESLEQESREAYHSSNSTLKVLAFENMLSYAPMRVRIASTGQSLLVDIGEGVLWVAEHTTATYLADWAGTRIPSCAMIYVDNKRLCHCEQNLFVQHQWLSFS